MTESGPGGGLRNSLYRRITRSGRRMTVWRRMLYALAVPLGLGIIRFWWLTCRVVRVEGAEHLDAALAKAPSLVPVLLASAPALLRQVPRGAALARLRGGLAHQPVGGRRARRDAGPTALAGG